MEGLYSCYLKNNGGNICHFDNKQYAFKQNISFFIKITRCASKNEKSNLSAVPTPPSKVDN